ncbi:MAG: vWA domain-containing protein [Leptospiraceae bacterium]|nr:vWA domain-containing protein [Leptospiraceae bacterium]
MRRYLSILIAIFSFIALVNACSEKKKKPIIIPAMNIIIANTDTTGVSATTQSTAPSTDASGAATTSATQTSGYTVTLPQGLVQGTTPTGDFTGMTYQGSPSDVAGFISQIPDQGTNSSSTLGTSIIGLINAAIPSTNIATSSLLSNSHSTGSTGSTSIYHLTITTDTTTNVTGLSNLLIGVVGTNQTPGTVSTLPTSQGSESTSNSFHVILQVVYNSNGPELIGVGVSTTAGYANNEALLANFLDGTNITYGTVTKVAKSDGFTGAADPKADFVWVIDNSGSMSQEQTAVSNAATTFFTTLSTKRLDYRIGVITTDSSTLRTAGGTAWVTNSTSNAQTAFTSNTNAGTGGSGSESGIYFAEQGLNNSNLTPRSGSKLYFIIVTDEADHYGCRTGGTRVNDNDLVAPNYDPCNGGTDFNTSSNIFTQNNYKVFTIQGINSGTGLSGTCTGANGTSAASQNNVMPEYYNLAVATGGSAASICSSDFSPIMSSMVTEAAAGSSPYILSKTPISSTISVTVNGSAVAKSASNGWSYDSGSNSIIFSGSAYPAVGATISVTYEYNSSSVAFMKTSNSEQSLTAYIGNVATDGAVQISLLAILIAGIALLIRRKLASN